MNRNQRKINKKYLLVIFLLFSIILNNKAKSHPDLASKDTLVISFHDAEQKFLKYNMQLLSARFNIESTRAIQLQTQLWSNPNLSIEQNIYNQTTGKVFDFTSTGNTEVQLQQLFLLAGKREKQYNLATINTKSAELSYFELIRLLRSQIHIDLYHLYFLQQSLNFYDETLPSVRRTVASASAVYDKRSLLLSEVLRLKSLLFSLENERLGLINQISEIQMDLRVLLRDTSNSFTYYVPRINKASLDSLKIDSLNIDTIIKEALENRPDYMLALNTINADKTNIEIQKALAVPDVSVGLRWSRAGSYIPDYYALNMSVDLPVFNRNQGNIKVAEMTAQADYVNLEQTSQIIQRDVINAYRHALDIDAFYKSFDKTFTTQYKSLVEGMVSNFEKRNITIIEFTDFYESYRTSMLQLNQLESSRAEAIEAINLSVGKNIVNP